MICRLIYPSMLKFVDFFREEYKFVFVRHFGDPVWNFSMLENRTSLSRRYSEQWIRKCFSSSKTPQILQVRSLILTFGLECLSRSIASVWELGLSWDTAVLYLWFFNMFRYGSIPTEHLNLLYVLNMGCVYSHCLRIPWQSQYILR